MTDEKITKEKRYIILTHGVAKRGFKTNIWDLETSEYYDWILPLKEALKLGFKPVYIHLENGDIIVRCYLRFSTKEEAISYAKKLGLTPISPQKFWKMKLNRKVIEK